ncbi:hypothetical protein EJ06DRAFT_478260 [Trichodelitschia bisporula]|uniref:Pyruvate dehydrogenase protein x component n=1 Tax=Trichodelitschia bisporula TaxID=703511 RepID=A0A6G1HUE9_9PEZI|nr:hypothetical protein EJ06DRAFT_478260 [Trichodelitschia bisporula]
MPALSPTMTEGNISSWKVKEGDSFSAGDVLLEVETDKAQMDVEAQDDGMMAKITHGDGSKTVKVGTRIAVLAEPGDDLSTLSIPEEDTTPTASEDAPKEVAKSEPSPPKSDSTSSQPSKPKSSSASSDPKRQNPKYPLYPSVSALLHEHDLSASDIPASGPGGRLLKGDVLAFLGAVPDDYASQLSARLAARSHLDLSDVKPAAPKAPAKETAAAKPALVEKAPPVVHQIAVPVSLAAVVETQRRVQQALGIHLPVSTFVARAVALANEDLPPVQRAATADELFDAVLGVKPGKRGTHGRYVPVIETVGGVVPVKAKKVDVMDEILSMKKAKKAKSVEVTVPGEHVFSLAAQDGEVKRATVFLERVKSALEAEPGRLVL